MISYNHSLCICITPRLTSSRFEGFVCHGSCRTTYVYIYIYIYILYIYILYIYILYIYITKKPLLSILHHLRVVNSEFLKQRFDDRLFQVSFYLYNFFSLFTIYYIKVYKYYIYQYSLEAS